MNAITLLNISRLLQFSDSACPIGSFAFSCGLESAAHCNIVHDAISLKEYTASCATQSAYSDCIAAIHAHRAALINDFNSIANADYALLMTKLNDEARIMLQKMGRKLVELTLSITQAPILSQVLDNIKSNNIRGTYPVIQGTCFAVMNIGECELFTAHQYGVVSMILNAALRCVKVSHIDTQKILFDLMAEQIPIYEEIKDFALDEMHSFCPEADILTSIHEKGHQRMFMS